MRCLMHNEMLLLKAEAQAQKALDFNQISCSLKAAAARMSNFFAQASTHTHNCKALELKHTHIVRVCNIISHNNRITHSRQLAQAI